MGPPKFKLGETVLIGRTKWEVGAVMWIGERYYMLTRRRNPNLRDTSQVALMPESVIASINT
jgi:hypothetical protein